MSVDSGPWNIAGFGISAAGAALGVYGALLQANGYYSFPLRSLPGHAWRLAKWFLRSREDARSYLDSTLALAKVTGERRERSFLGLYWVLAGFLAQLAGNVISLAASLRGGAQ